MSSGEAETDSLDQQETQVLAVVREWVSAGNGSLHVEAHEVSEFVADIVAAMLRPTGGIS